MEVEFDDHKNAINLSRHGLSLIEGAKILLDPDKVCWEDKRHDYGEKRWVCLGLFPNQSICGRVFVVVYTLRNGVHRVISVRKANAREQNYYNQFE